MSTGEARDILPIPSATTDQFFSILFEYSADEGATWVQSKIGTAQFSDSPTDTNPPDGIRLTVGTEDSDDGDNNDTVLTLDLFPVIPA